MTNVNVFSLASYDIALKPSLPVGSQRISSRKGVVLQAIVENQTHYVEIAPLSGHDDNDVKLQGFSSESLTQVVDELRVLLPQIASDELSLTVASEQTQLASVAWGLSLLANKINRTLPSRLPNFKPIPLVYLRKQETLTQLTARLKALPTPTHAKIKVGQIDIKQELSLIFAVRSVWPTCRLRLDANQGFDYQDALDFCACLPKSAIEYIEEPCKNPVDNAALYAATGIHYALDESLVSQPDFAPTIAHFDQGLRALILKPMLQGNIDKLQQLIEQADNAGIRCILSSSLEGSLGIRDIQTVAAALTPTESPGIDTLTPFQVDLIQPTTKTECMSFDSLPIIFSTEKL